ncbi:hypothetical protein Chor_006057 [Crotalus horridus]
MAAPSWLWVPQLFLYLVFPSSAALLVETLEQVCGCCAGPMRNESAAAVFCGSRMGTVRRGRCCLERNKKIILGALPQKLDCPGGSEVWKNVTIQGNNRICHDQRNSCNGSLGLVWVCPEGSLCTSDGPGLSQCLCVDPYHGYKCLRQGNFPYLLFFGTLGAITITLSTFLWTTQRHKAKTI